MGVIKNFVLRCGADFSAITTQSVKAANSMKTMTSSVSSSCTKMTAAVDGLKKAFSALGIGLSFAAITAAAKDAYSAYQTQIEAESQLAQVMRNTMNASNDEIQSILDLTSAQQQLGVVGDEVQIAGAQELSTYLEQTSTLKTLIPVMNDMVAQQYGYSASGENAASIATMLGKVMEGQTSALSRLGYSFTSAQEQILKYGTEEQRAATLAEVVEQSVGGMNAALAKTPAGRMQQLSNTLGDIKEQFGKAVSTIATTFLPLLNKVASLLADVATLANKVAQAIANVFGGKSSSTEYSYAGAASNTSDAVDDLSDSYNGVTKSANKAAAAQKAALSLADIDTLHQLKFSSSSSSDSDDDDDDTNTGTNNSGITTSDGLDEAAESSSWLEEKLQALKDLFGELDFTPLKEAWDNLKKSLEPLVNLIKDGLKWCWDNVLVPLAHWTIEQAVPAVVNLLAAAFDALTAVLEALKPVFQWIWENILVPIAQWTGDLFIAALEEITDLLHDFADLLNGKISFSEFINQLSTFQKIVVDVTAAVLAFKVACLALTAIEKITSIVMAAKAALTGFGTAAAAATSAASGTATAASAAGTAASSAATGATAAATGFKAFAQAGALGTGALVALSDSINAQIGFLQDCNRQTEISSSSTEELGEKVKAAADQYNSLNYEYNNQTILGKLVYNTSSKVSNAYQELTEYLVAYSKSLEENGQEMDAETAALIKETGILGDHIQLVEEDRQRLLQQVNAVEKQAQAHTQAAEKIQKASNTSSSSVQSSVEKTSTSIQKNISEVGKMGSSAQSAAQQIKSAFNGLNSVGSSAGSSLAQGFSSALQGMVTTATSIVSQIRSLFSSATSSTTTYTSTTTSRYSGLSAGLGTIPHLATGAVIPPNSEFAAILGDQTSGYNIETPEDMLRQIFREETQNSGEDLLSVATSILSAVRAGRIIEVDGDALGRTSRRTSASLSKAYGY